MDKSKLTPMLRQFYEVKEAHPDKLILFRMGDFYETFIARSRWPVSHITLWTTTWIV